MRVMYKTAKGRLSPAGVARIRELRATNPRMWTYLRLATELGVSIQTIFNVCKGKTHVGK